MRRFHGCAGALRGQRVATVARGDGAGMPPAAAEKPKGIPARYLPEGGPPVIVSFVIITGLSGAGKSEAIRSFEDLGYFCVDNLPANLIPPFYEMCHESNSIERVAIVCDVRGGHFFHHLEESLEVLERAEREYSILFLEASDDVLVRRFKGSRRRHPLAREGDIKEGIQEERRRLQGVRGRAHRIIDTSRMTPHQLKEAIAAYYAGDSRRRMTVRIVSFSFREGVPTDADLVFDVRFLPNPHWVESLAPRTGREGPVIDYIFKWPVTRKFMEKLLDMMDFLIPHYLNEGKSHLVVAIGCTGGRHRSVAIADRLTDFLQGRGYDVSVEHRDLASS